MKKSRHTRQRKTAASQPEAVACLRKTILVAIAAAAVSTPGFSQTIMNTFTSGAEPEATATQPDGSGSEGKSGPSVERGRAIVMNGASRSGGQPNFPCFTCHGEHGAGMADGGFPRLSGQSYSYLYRSLRDFASGRRENEVMQQVAKTLDDQAMKDVAAYFSQAKPETMQKAEAAEATTIPDPDTLMKGGIIAAVGDMSRGVQACTNCHGPEGAGLPPVYPYLAGQYADYLEKQLTDWKSGKRTGDPLNVMREIAGRLTDDEVHAVAVYYASIRPSNPIAVSLPSGKHASASGTEAGKAQETSKEENAQ